MADTYEIQYQDKAVGHVQVQKQGLYLCFSCRCRLPDEGMYRIHACSGDVREDLGICIPINDAFGTDKKIPLKRLGDGELTFQLVPKDWKPETPVVIPEPVPEEPQEEQEPEPEPVIELPPEEETFIPVSEAEPFVQLDMLENAVMEVRDGQPGIAIQE